MSQDFLVYIPVEKPRREIISKCFLANLLANKGFTVALFDHTYFDRFGWPSKGLYLGKNFFRTEQPYDLRFYKKMKQKGIQIWHLDEEGGVYPGNNVHDWENCLKNRLNPNDLNIKDKILTWGVWQSNYFKKINDNIDIIQTGSPIFDLLQKKYNDVFYKYDLKVTKNKKNFILINTRFSHANPIRGFRDKFGTNSPISKNFSLKHLSQLTKENSILQHEFIEMIFFLLDKKPNLDIVIRPHPSENIEIYKVFFKNSKVYISDSGPIDSWIRMCKVLIHNGCTTAIQGYISEKKIISYEPLSCENLAGPKLTNQLSNIVSTKESLLEEIENIGNLKKNDHWKSTISVLDSINKIYDLVEQNFNKYKNNKISIFLMRIRFIYYLFVDFLKIFFKRNIILDYEDIKKLNKISSKFYGKSIKIKKINSNFLIFRK